MTLAAAGHDAQAVRVVESAIAMAPADAGLLEYEGKLLGELRRSSGTVGKRLQAMSRSLSIRVDQLDRLRRDGAITEDEYRTLKWAALS